MSEENATLSETPASAPADDRLTRDEVNALIADALAARDKEHADELAAVRATFPSAMVPANGGGPGVDNHQSSWSLAEQELAAAGETLDHWE